MGAFDKQANGVTFIKDLKTKLATLATTVNTLAGQLASQLDGQRVVRGTITAGGTAGAGAGFSSVKNATGDYTVTFSPPFSGVPSVTFGVGSTGGIAGAKHKDGVAATGFSVYTFTVTPALMDSEFHFVAVGPV